MSEKFYTQPNIKATVQAQVAKMGIVRCCMETGDPLPYPPEPAVVPPKA